MHARTISARAVNVKFAFISFMRACKFKRIKQDEARLAEVPLVKNRKAGGAKYENGGLGHNFFVVFCTWG